MTTVRIGPGPFRKQTFMLTPSSPGNVRSVFKAQIDPDLTQNSVKNGKILVHDDSRDLSDEAVIDCSKIASWLSWKISPWYPIPERDLNLTYADVIVPVVHSKST